MSASSILYIPAMQNSDGPSLHLTDYERLVASAKRNRLDQTHSSNVTQEQEIKFLYKLNVAPVVQQDRVSPSSSSTGQKRIPGGALSFCGRSEEFVKTTLKPAKPASFEEASPELFSLSSQAYARALQEIWKESPVKPDRLLLVPNFLAIGGKQGGCQHSWVKDYAEQTNFVDLPPDEYDSFIKSLKLVKALSDLEAINGKTFVFFMGFLGEMSPQLFQTFILGVSPAMTEGSKIFIMDNVPSSKQDLKHWIKQHPEAFPCLYKGRLQLVNIIQPRLIKDLKQWYDLPVKKSNDDYREHFAENFFGGQRDFSKTGNVSEKLWTKLKNGAVDSESIYNLFRRRIGDMITDSIKKHQIKTEKDLRSHCFLTVSQSDFYMSHNGETTFLGGAVCVVPLPSTGEERKAVHQLFCTTLTSKNRRAGTDKPYDDVGQTAPVPEQAADIYNQLEKTWRFTKLLALGTHEEKLPRSFK